MITAPAGSFHNGTAGYNGTAGATQSERTDAFVKQLKLTTTADKASTATLYLTPKTGSSSRTRPATATAETSAAPVRASDALFLHSPRKNVPGGPAKAQGEIQNLRLPDPLSDDEPVAQRPRERTSSLVQENSLGPLPRSTTKSERMPGKEPSEIGRW